MQAARTETTKLTTMLRRLKENNLKDLAGNGMHLPCIAAWYLYVMSNVVRKEDSKLIAERALAKESVREDKELSAEDEIPTEQANDAEEEVEPCDVGAEKSDDRPAFGLESEESESN